MPSMFNGRGLLKLIQWSGVTVFLVTLLAGWWLPDKSELWVRSLFWGLFWPVLTVTLLLLSGPLFCAFCPLGVLGRSVSRFGLGRRLPQRLNHMGWSLATLLGSYWLVNAAVSGGYGKLPLTATLIFFSTFLLLMLLMSIYYRDAPFCRSLCPFAVIAQGCSNTSSLTVKSSQDCQNCRSVECSRLCPQRISLPLLNDSRQHQSCNLCLACFSQCSSLSLGYSTHRPQAPRPMIYAWAYIALIALVTIQTQLQHRWDRSSMKELLPWNTLAEYLSPSITLPWLNVSGLLLTLFALLLTATIVWSSAVAASTLIKDRWQNWLPDMLSINIPLLLCLLLSHGLMMFMSRGISNLVNGLAQLGGNQWQFTGVARDSDIMPWFSILLWLGVGWSLLLAWKWAKPHSRSALSHIGLWGIGSSLIWLFLALRFGGIMLDTATVRCH